MSKIVFLAVRIRDIVRVTFICLLFLFIAGSCIYFFMGLTQTAKVSSDLSDNLDKTERDGSGGKLAIIIDDFGSGREGVAEMMAIDRHLTFAVMPFLPHSHSDAEEANKKGYEVIVHLPMEPNKGKLSWLGPRPILAAMCDNEVKQIVMDSFESVPFAVGANIHMGSKASSDESIISSVLDVIKEKGLFFVDSRTSTHPISMKLANNKEVLCYDRDVFLDGQKPKSYVKQKLREAGEIALKKGYAVAIGHVGIEGGKVTAQAISEMLPEFDRMNVELVFVSELPR